MASYSAESRVLAGQGRSGKIAQQLDAQTGEATNPQVTSPSEHPLVSCSDALSSVLLMHSREFKKLICPLPRCQDLPLTSFGIPTAGDTVCAVSHGWRNQAHPDPNGRKHKDICDLLCEIEARLCKDVFVFFDFISIPQRPFKLGQGERTDEEIATFKAALDAMNQVYLHSDCSIHMAMCHESTILGDAVMYSVPASSLHEMIFDQVGDFVQITGERAHAQHAANTRDGGLFDRVLAVNGLAVKSPSQVAAAVASRDASTIDVELRRHPFGQTNTTPSDDRGWIFGERFSTMVQCAMLSSEGAAASIFTDSQCVRDQIESGATRFRQAASESDQAVEHELSKFLAELGHKTFSAASTDKLEIDAAAKQQLMSWLVALCCPRMPDREVVTAIMKNHADILRSSGWAFKNHMVTLDHFSPLFREGLKVAPMAVVWPVVSLFLVALPSLLIFSCLSSAPGEGHATQALLWILGSPFTHCTHLALLPPLLLGVGGREKRNCRTILSLLAWGLCCSMATSFMLRFVAAGFDISLALLHVLVEIMVFALLMLPSLMLCIPAEQRANKCLRQRWLSMFFALEVGRVSFGVILPLSSAAMLRQSDLAQALGVLVHLVFRLFFEHLGSVAARQLGEDATPCFLFTILTGYESSLRGDFLVGRSWSVFAALAVSDALAGAYHILGLRRMRGEPGSGKGARSRQQYAVCMVALRGFVQLTVPAQHFLALLALRAARPHPNEAVCGRPGEHRDALIMLAGDFGVELLVAVVTCAVLWRKGFAPLRMLWGLVAMRLDTMLAISAAVTMGSWQAQHSHVATDLDFGFSGVASTSQQCGLRWWEG